MLGHNPRVNPIHDVAIIGGGIVGLSTAAALKRQNPRAAILVLEKEQDWAQHQTGRNSGVIHSGIYYKPGSFKAEFCRAGNRSMVAFCRQHGVPHEICGKVIVATEPSEVPLLERLYLRGIENSLRIERISPEELREIEPHVVGLAAIRVRDAGIVDYKAVCRALVTDLQAGECALHLGAKLLALRRKADRIELITPGATFIARRLVNCAGLHSDRIARLGRAQGEEKAAAAGRNLQIVPFRGEYFELKPQSRHLVRHLVYPVPDPSFPFLGVHFTRMVGGRVEAGPNAVLALAREGYLKTDIDLRDLCEVIAFPGFRKLCRRHWREALREQWRSISKHAFLRSLQRLIPGIGAHDLVAAPSGIRAQALSSDGTLLDDFQIVDDGQCLHVCNAPSPAATASIEIARHIAARLSPHKSA